VESGTSRLRHCSVGIRLCTSGARGFDQALRRLMLVARGFAKRLAVNEAATALYASRCRPDSAPVIVGDVVIVAE
jgi:hypothetical protein